MEDSLAQDEQSQEDKKCILPWIHQYGELSGEYGLCCFSIYADDKNYSFGKGQTPKQAFNNDFLKQTRLAMLRNEYVKACDICYNWEKEGIDSPRKRANLRFSEYKKLYETTKPDGSVSTPPIYIDFRFGNLCNFSCRMCGSLASSSWAKEDKYYGRLDKTAPNHYDHWTDNEDFWKDINDIKKYIKVIYFAGGEPFVQIGHYKLLELLVNSDLAKDVELTYNTNLSYDGSFKGYDIEDLWSHFKKIELWPSIEGFDEQAEYGRRGLSIDLFKSNSIKFSKYITTYSLVSSVYSITSNIELIKWIKSINKTFNITNLVNPPQLSTTIFSEEVKRQILHLYKKELTDIDYLDSNEIHTILDSLKHMNSKDDSYLSATFKQKNTQSDLFRNENFEAVYPELAEWYRNI